LALRQLRLNKRLLVTLFAFQSFQRATTGKTREFRLSVYFVAQVRKNGVAWPSFASFNNNV
jgi:hypothetical protein